MKRDWRRRVRSEVPLHLPMETPVDLDAAARSAWRLFGCRDLAWLDFRLDAASRPQFLKCNPLPELAPVNSNIVIPSQASLLYQGLVQDVARGAAHRFEFTPP